MWDLPGPGLKPVSPALAGGFLTTVPPGKPMSCVLYNELVIISILLNPMSHCIKYGTCVCVWGGYTWFCSQAGQK